MNRLSMRITFAGLIALTGWFAVITQYVLMFNNSALPGAETTIRFFSYFTILTNILVAISFTVELMSAFKRPERLRVQGSLTAATVYITVVGLVYQVVLRGIWDPQGMQRLVDELLHTIIPISVIVFWLRYERTSMLQYRRIRIWLLYPFIYLLFILFRGTFSGFYPYPFIDVAVLGLPRVILNAFLMLVLFVVVSLLYVFLGKKTADKSPRMT